MTDQATRDKLSTKQRRAIVGLLETGDVSQSADVAGVNRATIYKWREDPAFMAELHRAEAVALGDLATGLAGMGTDALAALREGLDPAQPMTIRLRAAGIYLDRALRVLELVTLEERIANLETVVGK